MSFFGKLFGNQDKKPIATVTQRPSTAPSIAIEGKVKEKLKHCQRCEKELPRDAFNKCLSAKDGLQYKCRKCQKAMTKKYLKKNRENYAPRTIGQYRHIHMKKVTKETFNQLSAIAERKKMNKVQLYDEMIKTYIILNTK